jgi:PadR family transcriptional regulator, regulatory protein PadR
MNLSKQAMKILASFDGDSRAEKSGADIGRQTKLLTGTLYPLLLKLEKAELLVSEWEKGDPSELGRPRRRYYRITGLGQRCLIDEQRAIFGGVTA